MSDQDFLIGDDEIAVRMARAAHHVEHGDDAAANIHYDRSLLLCEETLRPDHPGTAASLNNLAYLLHAQGDYTAARSGSSQSGPAPDGTPKLPLLRWQHPHRLLTFRHRHAAPVEQDGIGNNRVTIPAALRWRSDPGPLSR